MFLGLGPLGMSEDDQSALEAACAKRRANAQMKREREQELAQIRDRKTAAAAELESSKNALLDNLEAGYGQKLQLMQCIAGLEARVAELEDEVLFMLVHVRALACACV